VALHRADLPPTGHLARLAGPANLALNICVPVVDNDRPSPLLALNGALMEVFSSTYWFVHSIETKTGCLVDSYDALCCRNTTKSLGSGQSVAFRGRDFITSKQGHSLE